LRDWKKFNLTLGNILYLCFDIFLKLPKYILTFYVSNYDADSTILLTLCFFFLSHREKVFTPNIYTQIGYYRFTVTFIWFQIY
jgi:hypothetical protein